MEQFVNAILEYSRKESDHDYLIKLMENNMDKLRSVVNHVGSALKTLNAKHHSIGIVYLLLARAKLPQVDEEFLMLVEQFLLTLDGPQTRKVANRFCQVVHRYSQVCLENNLSMKALRYLLTGIERFRLNSEYLTPLHQEYLCLCLKAKNYKAGFDLIETQIFDIDPTITGLTPRDMLLYYYYGGMVYIGVKQYTKSLDFFNNALTVPAYALSAIMVECFKKFVLVSLLVHGKFLGISKNATQLVHRHMKTFCSQYVDFANAFASNDNGKVKEIVDKNQDLFQKDNNYGLVKQCMSSLYTRNIQRLTATFMTLSLNDIAKMVNLPNGKAAESILLRMIENGEINAVINQKDGMVSFEEDVYPFNHPQTTSSLDTRIQRSVELSKRLKSIDENISSSTTYVARLYGLKDDMIMDMDDKGSRMMQSVSKLFGMWR